LDEPSLGPLKWASEEAGGLSGRHILRMAAKGKFPQPIRVTEGGEHQKGRIAFVRSEVRAWIAARIASRDAVTGPAPAAENPAPVAAPTLPVTAVAKRTNSDGRPSSSLGEKLRRRVYEPSGKPRMRQSFP
jgi:predicted DNA-binding transcriptional regulator AlpA